MAKKQKSEESLKMKEGRGHKEINEPLGSQKEQGSVHTLKRPTVDLFHLRIIR